MALLISPGDGLWLTLVVGGLPAGPARAWGVNHECVMREAKNMGHLLGLHVTVHTRHEWCFLQSINPGEVAVN